MKAVGILISVLLGLMVLACAGEVPVSTVVDDTAPLVTSCLPAPAAVGQPRNVRLSITFDEALDPASVGTNSILLQPVSGGTEVRPSSLVLSSDKKNVRVYLAGELAASTQYEVRLSKDIRNLAGLALGDHSWRFTTGTQLTRYALDLAVTAPVEGTLVRSSLTLAGTLGPVAELASLQYAVNTTNGMLSWRPIEVDPAQAGAWSFRLYTWEESFVEGTNTVYLRAVNISNETSMARVAIRVDNTMPTVRLDWPPSNTTISGTVQLRGSVLDAGGIAEVAYRIGTDDTWHSVSPTGTNWTVLVDTRAYPDSMRSVTVRAIDTARNTNMVSAVASQVLVDNWSGSKQMQYCKNEIGFEGKTFGMDVRSGVAMIAFGRGTQREAMWFDTLGAVANLGKTTPDVNPRFNADWMDLAIDQVNGQVEAGFTAIKNTTQYYMQTHASSSVAVSEPVNSGEVVSGVRIKKHNGFTIRALSIKSGGSYSLRVGYNTALPVSLADMQLSSELQNSHGVAPSVDIGGGSVLEPYSALAYYNVSRRCIRFVRLKFVEDGFALLCSKDIASLSIYLNESQLEGLTGLDYQTSIAIDKSSPEKIYVAYIDQVSGRRVIKMAVTTNGGESWVIHELGNTVSPLAPDIQVYQGVAYLSYHDSGNVFVEKFVSGAGFLRMQFGNFFPNARGAATRLRFEASTMYLGFEEDAQDYFINVYKMVM